MRLHHNYFVYILLCSDGSYYVGVSNDVDSRVAWHNNGDDNKAYTFNRRPVRLLYHEWYQDINQAISREKQLKGWSRAKKEALINCDEDALKHHAKFYAQRGSSSSENE